MQPPSLEPLGEPPPQSSDSQPTNQNPEETHIKSSESNPSDLRSGSKKIEFNIFKNIPVLSSLFSFLEKTLENYPPQLGIAILIDVAVLVIGLSILLLFKDEQKIAVLLILVVVILVNHMYAYSVNKASPQLPKKKQPKKRNRKT